MHRKSDQLRFAVTIARVLEDFFPSIFRITEDGRYELAQFIGWRASCSSLLALVAGTTTCEDFSPADEHARVNPERPTDESENKDGSYPQSADSPATKTASILDILTAAEIFPAHDEHSCLCGNEPDLD